MDNNHDNPSQAANQESATSFRAESFDPFRDSIYRHSVDAIDYAIPPVGDSYPDGAGAALSLYLGQRDQGGSVGDLVSMLLPMHDALQLERYLVSTGALPLEAAELSYVEMVSTMVVEELQRLGVKGDMLAAERVGGRMSQLDDELLEQRRRVVDPSLQLRTSGDKLSFLYGHIVEHYLAQNQPEQVVPETPAGPVDFYDTMNLPLKQELRRFDDLVAQAVSNGFVEEVQDPAGNPIYAINNPEVTQQLEQLRQQVGSLAPESRSLLDLKPALNRVFYREERRHVLSSDDPYVRLGANPGATPEEIRRAYMRRIFEFHPDRYLGSDGGQISTRLNEAYSTLTQGNRPRT